MDRLILRLLKLSPGKLTELGDGNGDVVVASSLVGSGDQGPGGRPRIPGAHEDLPEVRVPESLVEPIGAEEHSGILFRGERAE